MCLYDLRGKRRIEALFCTDVQATPVELLQWVVRHWSVQVAFAEGRAHLGLETQRQWSEKRLLVSPRSSGTVLPCHCACVAVKLERADPRAGNGVVSQNRADLCRLFALGAWASLARP